MARNFHSSMYAMSNLVIGLARGYRKHKKMLMRRRPNLTGIELRDEMIENLEDGLGAYFPAATKRKIAETLYEAVELFEEQR